MATKAVLRPCRYHRDRCHRRQAKRTEKMNLSRPGHHPLPASVPGKTRRTRHLRRLDRRHGGCPGARTDFGVHLAEHQIGQGLLLDFRRIDAPRHRPSTCHHRRIAPRRGDCLAAHLAAAPPLGQANQVLSSPQGVEPWRLIVQCSSSGAEVAACHGNPIGPGDFTARVMPGRIGRIDGVANRDSGDGNPVRIGAGAPARGRSPRSGRDCGPPPRAGYRRQRECCCICCVPGSMVTFGSY